MSAAPRLVYAPHPLTPAADRRVLHTPFEPGEPVAGYLERCGVPLNRPLVVAINGRPCPRERWRTVCPHEGDLITVRGALHDGGGSGGSNPVRSLLTIAVALAATVAAPLILGPALAGTVAFGSLTYGTLFTGLVTLGGTLLINGLFPPPSPDLARSQRRLDNASPTYSLTGGANQIRPYEPMPVVFGRHIIRPDLGARTYTEFDGEDQYLYQVFNFGLADVTLTEFRIGDTPLTAYDDVETEESGADGALTLFPGNVDTIAGGTLTIDAGWVERTSSINATALAVDITGSLYLVGETGIESLSCTLQLQYRAVGAGTWLPLAGDASGFVTLTSASRKAIRRTYRVEVASGQYEVRVQRVTAESTSAQEVSEFGWSQLRTYQPDTANYDGQKRVAMRIRASGQVNGQVDTFSAVAQARVPVWTGASWTTQATSNPAWLYLWFARGVFDGAERVLGAGLDDSRIDIDAIKAWGAWCAARALTCDFVWDRSGTVQEVLSLIARCGRATPTHASGKLGVVWDQAELPVVQVFTPVNMRAGTFEVEYATGDLADEIVATFIDPDMNWQPNTVRVTVPGTTTPVRPSHVELLGITSPQLAARDANLQAARHAYHRRRVSWETDFEGMVCNRGDVVALSHDTTRWAQAGRLIAGTATVLTLDRAVTFTEGQQHYLQLRSPSGALSTYGVQYQAGSASAVTLTSAIPGTSDEPVPDADTVNVPLDYVWLFEPVATPGKRVKVVDVRPVSEHHVRLTAIDEVTDYYLAEWNTYTYTLPGAATARLPTVSELAVSEDLIRAGAGFATRITLDWRVDGQYGAAVVRVAENDGPLEERGRVLGTRFEFTAPASGTLTLEVTVFNLAGEYGDASRQTLSYTILGKAAPPGDIPWMVMDGATISFGTVADVDVAGYRFRFHYGDNRSWGDAGRLHEGLVTESPWTPTVLPSGTVTILGKAIDTSGNESVTPAVVVLELGDPIVANVVESVDEHAAGFPGTITGATVNGGTGDLEADDASGLMWGVAAANMWQADATTLMWASTVYSQVVYETTITPTAAAAGSAFTIAHTITASAFLIEYRRQGPDAMWTSDAADMWAADSDTLMWTVGGASAPEFQPWPGSVVALNEPFDFRITLAPGRTRGVISALVFQVDLPDIIERLNDVAISSGGTRLTLTEPFTAILNIAFGLEDDGGSAVSVRYVDKNVVLGPLIKCYDAAGSATSGTVDVTVQGY